MSWGSSSISRKLRACTNAPRVGRPGYAGAGAGLGNILYVLAVVALIVIVLRLLGVWV